ncbi:MAG TPA: M28 family peptidase [Planctomycetes bacterium]|nr:M28 family peptidase [Planctomycetota bacterium]
MLRFRIRPFFFACVLLGSASLAGAQSANAALERALAAVRPANIEADLRFIASDELMGRDTPSSGQRIAARFIRARLQRLHFVPMGDGEAPSAVEGDTRGYFDHYRMRRSAVDTEASHAKIESGPAGSELAFGRDYYFYPTGAVALEREGEVVFAGEARADEVASLDLEGKWALVFDSDLPWREREANLAARGAIGCLVATPPDRPDEHTAGRAARMASWVSRGQLQVVGSEEEGAVFPDDFVARGVAKKLAGGRDLSSLEPGAVLGTRFLERRAVEDGAEEYELENVAGFWPGSDPELAKEVLIVSAHYDHVGVRDGQIYNGADDNGSGTCGLLAIAEALAAHGPMKRSILLLWVSGEEKGLKGSEAWTLAPTLPEGYRAVSDLNIDMIGRNAPDYLLVTPTRDHPAYNRLTRMIEEVAPLEGFPELGSCDEYWERSDHRNFSVNLGIPVAFLFSDVHEDYHQPTDTVDKIDFDKIARVSRVVVRMLDRLARE